MGMFDTSGSPLKTGFDHFYGYNCQRHAHSYFPSYLYNDDQRFELPGNDGKTARGVYAQDLIADETLRWIREVREQPFFLFYAITLPHGRHEIDSFGVYADKPWTDQQKAYAAQITRLDTDLGRLADLLIELGIERNTLLMFSGDNGSSFSEKSEIGQLFNQTMGGQLRGFKRSLYEGGLRNAAFAWWPGTVPAGRVSDEPWAFWDFLPTVAELTGSTLPDEVATDGHSLASFLKGGGAPQRDYFYWELHEGASLQAVRFGEWKAVRNGPGAAVELYDLATDQGETTDLARRHPDLVSRATSLMATARTEDPNWPLRDRRPAARKKK